MRSMRCLGLGCWPTSVTSAAPPGSAPTSHGRGCRSPMRRRIWLHGNRSARSHHRRRRRLRVAADRSAGEVPAEWLSAARVGVPLAAIGCHAGRRRGPHRRRAGAGDQRRAHRLPALLSWPMTTSQVRRNVLVLALCQAVSMTAMTITVTVTVSQRRGPGDGQGLATVPIGLQAVATMRRQSRHPPDAPPGRRFGFLVGARRHRRRDSSASCRSSISASGCCAWPTSHLRGPGLCRLLSLRGGRRRRRSVSQPCDLARSGRRSRRRDLRSDAVAMVAGDVPERHLRRVLRRDRPALISASWTVAAGTDAPLLSREERATVRPAAGRDPAATCRRRRAARRHDRLWGDGVPDDGHAAGDDPPPFRILRLAQRHPVARARHVRAVLRDRAPDQAVGRLERPVARARSC